MPLKRPRSPASFAAELGADVEVAKAGAFLHDLRKANGPQPEGSHAQIGAEFAERMASAQEWST